MTHIFSFTETFDDTFVTIWELHVYMSCFTHVLINIASMTGVQPV
jgi:hypothetical protein